MSQEIQNKYQKYTVLDTMLLIKMEADAVECKEREILKSARSSGIVLPKDNQLIGEMIRKTGGLQKGTIVAIGEGAFKDNVGTSPKLGDIVVFKRYSQKDIDKTDESEVWISMLQDIDVWLIEEPIEGNKDERK